MLWKKPELAYLNKADNSGLDEVEEGIFGGRRESDES